MGFKKKKNSKEMETGGNLFVYVFICIALFFFFFKFILLFILKFVFLDSFLNLGCAGEHRGGGRGKRQDPCKTLVSIGCN